ncbi:hypothetical protein ANN_22119 [Periplaneta americana]|uniref:Uncharacterized protein n=1 Tax=Periplaneta americana TaxID=6978 RepID=A0ABQ8S849_PERAM|nr:hypothetical protein ANN_22119 [Periplaneta americana]
MMAETGLILLRIGGLCEGGNEPLGSITARDRGTVYLLLWQVQRTTVPTIMDYYSNCYCWIWMNPLAKIYWVIWLATRYHQTLSLQQSYEPFQTTAHTEEEIHLEKSRREVWISSASLLKLVCRIYIYISFSVGFDHYMSRPRSRGQRSNTSEADLIQVGGTSHSIACISLRGCGNNESNGPINLEQEEEEEEKTWLGAPP